MADDLDQRIKRRAYEIWEREGRPQGREQDHWKLASEEIAIEDNLKQTLVPNPSGGNDDTADRPEPVEPLLSVETQTEGVAPAGQEDPQPAPAKRTRSTRNPPEGKESLSERLVEAAHTEKGVKPARSGKAEAGKAAKGKASSGKASGGKAAEGPDAPGKRRG